MPATHVPSTQEVTMPGTTALVPAQRFAAHRFACTLPYDGPWNLRWTIEGAAKVESFPGSYTAEEVATAVDLLEAAARADAGELTRGQVERIAGAHLRALDAGSGR